VGLGLGNDLQVQLSVSGRDCEWGHHHHQLWLCAYYHSVSQKKISHPTLQVLWPNDWPSLATGKLFSLSSIHEGRVAHDCEVQRLCQTAWALVRP